MESLSTVCHAGSYGYNCQERCMCANNAGCNPISGHCTCLAGWIGRVCAESRFHLFFTLLFEYFNIPTCKQY